MPSALALRIRDGTAGELAVVMRVLVLFASAHGQTHAVADAVGLHLERAGHRVTLADLADVPPSPAAFDAVVLGSRIIAERAARSLVDYARRHRALLEVRPTALFLVCLSAARPSGQPRVFRYLERTVRDLGFVPGTQAAFAGGLPYLRYGRVLRWLVRRFAAATGAPVDISRNHDLTSWDDVAAFAAEIAGRLAAWAPVQPVRAPRTAQPRPALH